MPKNYHWRVSERHLQPAGDEERQFQRFHHLFAVDTRKTAEAKTALASWQPAARGISIAAYQPIRKLRRIQAIA